METFIIENVNYCTIGEFVQNLKKKFTHPYTFRSLKIFQWLFDIHDMIFLERKEKVHLHFENK